MNMPPINIAAILPAVVLSIAGIAIMVAGPFVDAASKTGRKKVAVKIGIGNGTKMEILEGLKPGDRVVLPG